MDTGTEKATTGALAQGARERYLPAIRLFAQGIATHLSILHKAGHKALWIIAMDALPSRATVLDYGARWAIEPTFFDFKSRGGGLEASHLTHPQRLEHLLLIMALAMHWCVRVGRDDQATRPTLLEKKPSPNRFEPLALPQTLPQRRVLVHTRTIAKKL